MLKASEFTVVESVRLQARQRDLKIYTIQLKIYIHTHNIMCLFEILTCYCQNFLSSFGALVTFKLQIVQYTALLT